jgi:hypothetical protein
MSLSCTRYFRVNTNLVQHLHQLAMRFWVLFWFTENREHLFESRRLNLGLIGPRIIRPHANHKAILCERLYTQADSICGKSQQSRVNDAAFNQGKNLDMVAALRRDFTIRKE